MRTDRIAVGDLVLCRVNGRFISGDVLDVTAGRVNRRLSCPAAG